LILHAHLPFVRHPEYPRFLEEDWFFEALTETYLPLLEVFEGLARDEVPCHVTLSLSPTLLSMLVDPLLQERYLGYLDARIDALAGERKRTAGDSMFHPVVLFYSERYERLRRRFSEDYRGNVVGGFRRVMESGHIDIVTSGATHGYLPLLAPNEESLYAQIAMGVRTHERILGRRPRGIWLPECGYRPGFDRLLPEFGLDHFFLDSHGLINATPRPRYGVYRPVRTPAGPAAFARDPDSSRQVWSKTEGYPGDFFYREFYRDAGFDVHEPHIECLRHQGMPSFTGLKYYRITGSGDWKEPYRPEWAHERARVHAVQFLQARRDQIDKLATTFDQPPIVVAPYDAELLGHWWFEGPQWLDALLREAARGQSGIAPITPAEFLDRFPLLQTCTPAESSWGEGGFHEVWLNQSNDWIYPALHAASERMTGLVQRYPHSNRTLRATLNQAARELLLAQSSDWAFIMHAGTAVEYATGRLKEHLSRFDRCADMAESGQIDESLIETIRDQDNLFPDMDYRLFAKRQSG